MGGRRKMDGRQRSEIGGKRLQIKSAKDLKVYQNAYNLAMEIFQLSKPLAFGGKIFLKGSLTF
jgi:hypothetical protein